MSHPLLAVLLDAARGVFPPADGRVVFLPPLDRGLAAVVSLTGRAYVASDREPAGLDAYGSALAPEVLRTLAGPAGEVDTPPPPRNSKSWSRWTVWSGSARTCG